MQGFVHLWIPYTPLIKPAHVAPCRYQQTKQVAKPGFGVLQQYHAEFFSLNWLTLKKTIPWFERTHCSHYYLFLQWTRPLLFPQLDGFCFLLCSITSLQMQPDNGLVQGALRVLVSTLHLGKLNQTPRPVKPSRLTGKLSMKFATSQQWCCLMMDEECCLSAFLCSWFPKNHPCAARRRCSLLPNGKQKPMLSGICIGIPALVLFRLGKKINPP